MKKFRIIEYIFIAIVAIGCLTAGIVYGFITAEIQNYSGIENLKKFQPSIPTRIYDVNGEIIAELFQEKRELIAYEDLPSNLKNAFLAAEDKNFFDHFGIAPFAIIRAMGKNVKASVSSGKFRVVQGGSTITQQLAKRLFTKSEKNFARKALEAIIALQIEKKFTKTEILEMYFNQIFLGHGCYGIATSARFFFNKDVRHLTAIESSILAALPSKPNGFSPIRNPKEAYVKNKDTLKRMVAAGFLTKKKADKVYKEFWPGFIRSIIAEYPTKTARSKIIDKAPYFTDYVRQILISRFGKDVVYNEGLSIYTTLNLKRQLAGQRYLQTALKKQDKVSSKINAFYNSAVDYSLIGAYQSLRMIFSLPGLIVKRDLETVVKKYVSEQYLDSIDLLTLLGGAPKSNQAIESFRTAIQGISSTLKVEGAIIAIEPSTGYITTMVGGSEFNVANQYNRATQARRQPGSSFKPFVYGAGIAYKRINTATVLPDTPILDIDDKGNTWSPENYDGTFEGMKSVTMALAASINIISIRIFDLVGAENVIAYASKMVKVRESRFNSNPSLALGTTELTPFEMANAYAIYANRGRDVIPFGIRYVEDRDGNDILNIEEEVGNIIAAKQMSGTIQVISPQVAWVMTQLMQNVVNRGTPALPIRHEAKFLNQAAGKTGTTQNHTDAWFCGYTPDLATVVWVGYDKPFLSLGNGMGGSHVAAPIWAKYMKDAYTSMKASQFPKRPAGVQGYAVCQYTGKWPGPNCTKLSAGYGLPRSGQARGKCDGKHFKMKTVLDAYMERKGFIKKDD